MAAQYGQTAFLYHVALRWGADMDTIDLDGRSPLHWAAYKGYGDTIRLLLVMDASITLADREGCMPLHWAAIRGNGEACTLLLQVLCSAIFVCPARMWLCLLWMRIHQTNAHARCSLRLSIV